MAQETQRSGKRFDSRTLKAALLREARAKGPDELFDHPTTVADAIRCHPNQVARILEMTGDVLEKVIEEEVRKPTRPRTNGCFRNLHEGFGTNPDYLSRRVAEKCLQILAEAIEGN